MVPAVDPQAFLTPPPRHLAELRIDTTPSAVAFSAPCGAAKGAGRKRRCLLPSSSVRKRMLLELAPFDVAPPPSPSSTPPPPTSWRPSPSPPPSPMGSCEGSASFDVAPPPAPSSTPPPPTSWTPSPSPSPSPAGEFSFDTELRVVPPASPGNIFAFVKNPARNPGGCEARSGLSFLAPLGQAAKPADAAATSSELSKTPTATGPTANGGFVFAAPPDGLPTPTPTSTATSSALSFLASSPMQPLTPMGSTATGGFVGSSEPSLTPTGKGAVVPLISLKPARLGSEGTGDFAFPSPRPARTQIGSAPSVHTAGSIPLAGIARPPFVITASPLPPPLHNSGEDNHKRPSLLLRRAATCEHRKNLQLLDEQQESTPPPQKIAKTDSLAAGEASRSSTMSGPSARPTRPCCMFFTSPSMEAAKQEAQKAFTEASRSPTRLATPMKATKDPEVEVCSSPSERPPDSPREHSSTSPAVVCSGAEVVVRVTCKCGFHKEFSFDHRL